MYLFIYCILHFWVNKYNTLINFISVRLAIILYFATFDVLKVVPLFQFSQNYWKTGALKEEVEDIFLCVIINNYSIYGFIVFCILIVTYLMGNKWFWYIKIDSWFNCLYIAFCIFVHSSTIKWKYIRSFFNLMLVIWNSFFRKVIHLFKNEILLRGFAACSCLRPITGMPLCYP